MPFALGSKALAAGHRLAFYETIGSTSAEALACARAGDPGRLWVVASAQSRGHGRRGRPWQTPKGNLAASLLLVLPDGNAATPTLGFAAGLALETAIREIVASTRQNLLPLREKVPVGYARPAEEGELDDFPSNPKHRTPPLPFGALDLRLKWPNDVLLGGAKVAGILLEATALADGRSAVVIGIGVNVRHAPDDVPYPATSLAAAGIDCPAETLFTALSDAWVEQESLWNAGRGFSLIRDRWLECAAGLGDPIAVRFGDDTLRGTFETIDDEGRLIVRATDGSMRPVAAGDVYFGAVGTVR